MTDTPTPKLHPEYEHALSPAALAEKIKVAASTVRTWIKEGVAINGRVIKLTASLTTGCHFKTTWAEFEEFRRQCRAVRGLDALVQAPTHEERVRAGGDAKERAASMLG